MLKIGQVVIIRQRPTENGDTFNLSTRLVTKVGAFQSKNSNYTASTVVTQCIHYFKIGDVSC